MAFQAADSRSGPALFVAALAALAAGVCAVVYLTSLLFIGLGAPLVHGLGVVSVSVLLITAPIAIATSLLVRCRACDRLLLPLVYDGKSLFSGKSASTLAIVRTAIDVVSKRRAPCPHCGVEAHV